MNILPEARIPDNRPLQYIALMWIPLTGDAVID